MYRVPKLCAQNPSEFYKKVNHELLQLVEFEDEWLAAFANAAALLGHQLDDINWAGFYLTKQELLILGPFIGKPACSAIVIGNGVCGKAARDKATIVVPNVHDFPGHIACDEASQSEIVIPIMVDGQVRGVLDIDSPVKDRFKPADVAGLEEFVSILARSINWSKVKF